MSISKTEGQGSAPGHASVLVAQAALDLMLAEAARAAPDECCGILLGAGNHIRAALPAANIDPSPQTRFELDPQALVDAHRAARVGGPLVLGYYHSHPGSPPRPSATDAAMAGGDGRIWAIVGQNGDVMFWRDGEPGFAELSYEPVQG